MHVFKKNMLCLYIKYIIYMKYNINIYTHVNIFKIYTECVCIYICIINKQYTYIYYVNKLILDAIM